MLFAVTQVGQSEFPRVCLLMWIFIVNIEFVFHIPRGFFFLLDYQMSQMIHLKLIRYYVTMTCLILIYHQTKLLLGQQNFHRTMK